MRIGFFSFSLSGIGPRTRARTLIDELADRNEHDLVLVTGPDETYDHPSIERYHIGDLPFGLVGDFWKTKRAFEDVDVVHVPVNLYQVMYIRSLYSGPVVAGAGVQHGLLYRNFAKLLNVDHLIETHEYVSYLWERSGFKSTPVYPSVDRSLFFQYDQNSRKEVRNDLDIDNGQDMLLYVGALNEFKGAHIFDELTKKLGSSQTAVVAGNGPLENRFIDRDDVRYQGFVENKELPRLYNAADVTVVPSVAESFSLVSLESIACGTPVVTTTTDGTMVRLFKPRETYVWTEERSANSVLKAVNDLIEDEQRYTEQVEKGFNTIDEMELTISDTVAKHLSAYRAAIEHQ